MSDPAQNDHDPHSSSSPPFSGLSSSAPVSTSTSSPIQLLKVQVPGTNCSDHQISIQLTPATPTSSQCSEAGHLLASVKPPILTNQRTSNQIACFNHRIDLTASNDSMATPTLAKRMLPGPSNYDRINIGDPDELTVQGYILSKTKKCFFYLGVICTFGLLMLYAEWQPELKVKLTHSCCPLDEADVLILKNNQGDVHMEVVHRNMDTTGGKVQLTFFYHKKIKYIWHADSQQYLKLSGLEREKCGVIYSYTSGLSREESDSKLALYGPNKIDIEVKPIWQIVYDEMRTPFYMYQVFIVFVWIVQLYYQFSLCVLFFSILSISLHAYETRKQSKTLRAKVQSECEVTVWRNSSVKQLSSSQLVPGDVLLIDRPTALCCDAVLVDGGTCTVNESMLTGECVPVTKTSLTHKPDALYSPDINKKNTLYCGTEILQVQPNESGQVKAIVVRTGFSTAKGELVRGILYPKQGTTQLHADMIRCMKMFFMLGFPCMIYTAIVFSTYHVSNLDLAIIVIDIGTFLVPPLLPSVLTSVNVHAQKRLHKQQIFCLNSAYINAGGTVDVVCFDKTGTLTEDSLDFEGALPTVHNNHSKSLWSRLLCPESLSSIAESTPKSQTSPSIAPYFGPVTRALDQISLNPFQLTLATCHSLVQLNHEIIGEPLELRLFERLKWTLLAPDQSQQWWRAFGRPVERVLQRDLNAFELQSCGLVRKISDPRPTAGNDNLGQSARLLLAVLRQFPFESALQRMSVVVQAAIHHPNDSADFCSTGSNGKRRASLEEHRPEHASNDVLVLMKGSPENVTTFCLDNSFPADLSDRVRYYTGQGYRVLACASRTVRLLPGQRVDQTPRHELEQQMHFDGLLLFHNRVKPTSASTVEQLQDARIRAVMVTGDNLLTAVHVARECNIVKSHLQLLQVKAEMLGTDANGNHATTLSDNHHTAEGNQFDQESDTWSHVQLRSIEATKSFAKPDSKMKITYTLLKTIDVAEKTAVMVTMPYSTNGSETTKNGEQKIDISSDSSWSDESSHLSTKSPDLPYQLCADGRTVRLLMQHAPDLWSAFLEQGAVFARVSPTQKAEIVENLQFLAHRVAMVGDGANDCAALRQADCGLSLSGEQSAMAAAFSTQTGSVQALIPLLSECRAALAATCGAFKYQVGYCFVLLSAVMLMFWDGVFTSDGGYVIVDIVLNIAPPLLFGSTRAARRLHRKPPTGRLFAGRTLASVFSFVGWQTLLYFSVRALVQSQSWYEQPIVNPRSIKKSEPSHLALAILSVNMASYVIAAIIFAPGPPHRRPLHTNRLYLSLVAVNAAIVLFISLYPAPAWLLAYVNFRDVPDFGFKVTLLLINLVNFGLSYTWEVWALQKLLNSFERHFSFGKRERKPFERVQQHLLDLQSSGSWPPNLQARC